MVSFFFDEENKLIDKKLEYHYLSYSSKYAINKESKEYYDSNGILEKGDLTNDFKENDFKKIISERIRKIVIGEKYSNIVFLAGAGASVTSPIDPKYGKTVAMIADNIFKELHELSPELFTLEELSEKCKYNDGKIVDEDDPSVKTKLKNDFNLEDFLSTLFHYRPYVPQIDEIKFNGTIEKILQLIKDNTNYSYNSSVLKHGALLNFLSELSGKDGNKFSVVTTNYDVLIEQAAAQNNFIVFDGFNFTPLPKFDSNMFEWNLVKEVQNVNTREVEFKEKTFNLVKIHGSLTWERQNNGDILRKDVDSITDTNKMVMVFPSSDKFAQSYQEPYFELFTKFQELIKRPNTLLITSGFSFSDDHISKMITQAMKNNSSLKMLVTDYNISPLREWNNDTEQFDEIDSGNSKYNHNWAGLIKLMDDGYPISFLKATMNNDLVDYLSGRYINDEN